MEERCNFADRSWRKSLIFQLLEISGTMVEQAKCLKQGGEGFTGILEIYHCLRALFKIRFRRSVNGTICLCFDRKFLTLLILLLQK